MTVPSVLEDMSQDETVSIPALAALDLVAAGGGPMKAEVAARLASHGVKLLNHFGATELGALAPIFRPKSDYDWRYLRLRQDLGLQLLLIETDSSNQLFKLVAKPIGHTFEFTLQDKLELREGSTRDIRLLGRKDDVIVLANGEKVMPQLLESTLSELQEIKTAVVFGNGEFEVGVLLEPTSQYEANVDAVKSLAWAKILEVNPKLDAHARILDPAAVLVLHEGQAIPRSDKGSVMRMETYRAFQTEISSVYSQLGGNLFPTSPASQRGLDVMDLQGSLRHLIEGFIPLSSDFGEEDDLFELGLDSLKASRLQRLIVAQISQDIPEVPIPHRLVYRYPTLKSMAAHLGMLLDGDATEPIEPDMQAMDKFVDKFSLLPTPDSHPKRAIVLLTGSTGSIGSHLVARLVQLEAVQEVICVNRPTSGQQPANMLSRQRAACARHEVIMPDSLWSKITVIAAETRKANAGLPVDTYQELASRVTHIVHNAWPMDFKRPLSSFEPHFQSLNNLLQFALDASVSQSIPVRFVFHSSIAVTTNYNQVVGSDTGLVAEAPMNDPRIPSAMGYAQAKWVCEQIVERVAGLHSTSLKISIIRIGQIVGSTSHGVWNIKEHIPVLLRTAYNLRQLPNFDGVSRFPAV